MHVIKKKKYKLYFSIVFTIFPDFVQCINQTLYKMSAVKRCTVSTFILRFQIKKTTTTMHVFHSFLFYCLFFEIEYCQLHRAKQAHYRM